MYLVIVAGLLYGLGIFCTEHRGDDSGPTRAGTQWVRGAIHVVSKWPGL